MRGIGISSISRGAPIFFNLARAHFKLRDLKSAGEAVRRGLELAPDDPDGRTMAAQLAQMLSH